jgi:hypothetical protein
MGEKFGAESSKSPNPQAEDSDEDMGEKFGAESSKFPNTQVEDSDEDMGEKFGAESSKSPNPQAADSDEDSDEDMGEKFGAESSKSPNPQAEDSDEDQDMGEKFGAETGSPSKSRNPQADEDQDMEGEKRAPAGSEVQGLEACIVNHRRSKPGRVSVIVPPLPRDTPSKSGLRKRNRSLNYSIPSPQKKRKKEHSSAKQPLGGSFFDDPIDVDALDDSFVSPKKKVCMLAFNHKLRDILSWCALLRKRVPHK